MSSLSRKAIAARQAAASHKLVATNPYGVTSAVAYSDKATLEGILAVADPRTNPVIVPNTK